MATVAPAVLAEHIMAGTLRGGASRQVAAAVAAAIFRVALMPAVATDGSEEVQEVQEEVAARLNLVRPALTSLVAAGASEAKPSVSGAQRALRNCALHADLGKGALALPHTGEAAKRLQRGRCRQQKSDDKIKALTEENEALQQKLNGCALEIQTLQEALAEKCKDLKKGNWGRNDDDSIGAEHTEDNGSTDDKGTDNDSTGDDDEVNWQALTAVHVRASPTIESVSLGHKEKGTIVKGIAEGDWLKLGEEKGFIAIKSGGRALLHPHS